MQGRHLLCYEAQKTWLRLIMGNNRLHALILLHVHKNFLDNMNLNDGRNEFVDRKATKQSDIFVRITHNVCKITITLRYFPYIYISYQMCKMCSCVTWHHLLNRFPQANKISITD